LQPTDFDSCNGKCTVCNSEFEERYLQIDHKIPYEVGGDIDGKLDIMDYMLLCAHAIGQNHGVVNIVRIGKTRKMPICVSNGIGEIR
jgi:hypothetical protein